MKKNKVIIFYHRADMDGILSGQIAKNFHLSVGDEVTMKGVDYGDKLPTRDELKDYETIVIVDFSWDILLEAGEQELVWIDHHKTAIEKYQGKCATDEYLIDGVAACRLAWAYYNQSVMGVNGLPILSDYYNRLVAEPEVVRLAGEYDVWDHRDSMATIINLGLQVFNPEYIGDMLRNQEDQAQLLSAVRGAGQAIANYQKNLNKKAQENAYLAHLNFQERSLKALVLNARGNSLTFEGHPLINEAECLIMWVYAGNNRIRCSLYHAPNHKNIDLSAIAKAYGGGGHPGACGFECTRETFKYLVTE